MKKYLSFFIVLLALTLTINSNAYARIDSAGKEKVSLAIGEAGRTMAAIVWINYAGETNHPIFFAKKPGTSSHFGEQRHKKTRFVDPIVAVLHFSYLSNFPSIVIYGSTRNPELDCRSVINSFLRGPPSSC